MPTLDDFARQWGEIDDTPTDQSDQRLRWMPSIAYKTGQVVQVYSSSAKDWVDAKVISIENGFVKVNYLGGGGKQFRSWDADKSRRAAAGRAELLAKRGSTLTGSKIRRNGGGSG